MAGKVILNRKVFARPVADYREPMPKEEVSEGVIINPA